MKVGHKKESPMKCYGICIGSYISEDNFMFCMAKNKTEARSRGNLYRRQWDISDPILKIVEIPDSLKEDNDAKRKYAVEAT